MPEPIERFFKFGSQYYAAGRYAAFARLMPVAGNLLHHAVEMYLKGTLSQTMTLKNLKDNFKHRLPKIWNNYKSHAKDSELDRFDKVISSLHRFEEIRYPDKIMADKGWAWIIDTGNDFGTPVITENGVSKQGYLLPLKGVDDLAASIFDYVSHKGYLRRERKYYFVSDEALHYAQLDNEFFREPS